MGGVLIRTRIGSQIKAASDTPRLEIVRVEDSSRIFRPVSLSQHEKEMTLSIMTRMTFFHQIFLSKFASRNLIILGFTVFFNNYLIKKIWRPVEQKKSIESLP